VRREGDDLEAYKALATCSAGGDAGVLVQGTARWFEESAVLAVVPALLDELQVRELVPVLNQVERKADKGVPDLLLLGQGWLRAGDPQRALDALGRAVSLDPGNVEARLQLGYALLAQGRVAEARPAFRDALARERAGLRMTRLYAAAVAWPGPFLLLVGACVAWAAAWLVRRPTPLVDLLDTPEEADGGGARRMVAAVGGLATAVVGVDFVFTADRAAFGLLLALAAGSVVYALGWPLRERVAAGVGQVFGVVSAIYRGRVHRLLGRLSARAQVLVLVGSVAAIVLVLPLVPSVDVRVGLLIGLAALVVSTVGTLLLGVLERAASLRVALRWLAISGTVPFLLFFLHVERERLVRYWALRDTWDQLAGYALLWGLGVVAALLLARILSLSILRPLRQIMDTVAQVRAGSWDARTGVRRRDEIGALAQAVDDMAAGLAERERIKDTFRQYVDPVVAERLMSDDPAMARGRLVEAVVLFSDVRGFTSLSEGLPPEAIVSLLNDYLARMAPIVARWGGVVDKYMGDGMLAVWGVPEPIREGPLAEVPAERLAVSAALDMLDALARFNEELRARGLATVAIGVGIHRGELVAGPIGSPERKEYTVIGDTVNTAQRLEGVARGEDPLLVSGAVVARLGEGFRVEAREPVRLKGKAEPYATWAVRGRAPA
jgi:class 3 adenylate cyclase